MTQTMIKIEGEEYLNATEAAAFLGISATTFVKFQHEYHLRYKIRPGKGRSKFFKKADLVPLLEMREGESEG